DSHLVEPADRASPFLKSRCRPLRDDVTNIPARRSAMRLQGKVALVTGASRGIGREVALALGRAGVSVALLARDRRRLDEVAATLGPKCSLVVPADLADIDQVQAAFRKVIEHFGRIDVLVNNAGLADSHEFLQMDVPALAEIVDVNYRASVVLTRLAAERMAAQRAGHIVNVASLAGISGVSGAATYAGTKAALRLFTASLRLELGSRGIHLTDVVLGFVETDMLSGIETNPRVAGMFRRTRRLHLMIDMPAEQIGAAIVRSIERQQDVLVLPERSRYLLLPFQGMARTISRLLSPRSVNDGRHR
ncbi:MAG: SDR family NAD(P)-dependent oxidoreductase, partial [Dehalococcoidia bacterium]